MDENAIHEAGHAVVATLLHLKVSYSRMPSLNIRGGTVVERMPDANPPCFVRLRDGTLRQSTEDEAEDASRKARRWDIRNQIICLGAGPGAQQILFPERSWVVCWESNHLDGDQGRIEALLLEHSPDSTREMRDALKYELVSRAAELVIRNFGAIYSVAKALEEIRYLSGPEIKWLVENSRVKTK